jgi:PAS domain S-box-containing protein
MPSPLHIIHLEDIRSDAAIIARELKRGDIDCEIRWVTNKTYFQNALGNFNPDLVLCDHSLPTITSVEALQMVKQTGKRIPFILITATVSEEFAVNMMKEGIDDYILKDRLQRLPKAVTNVIEKIEAEKEKESHYAEITSKEKKFRALLENISDAIVLMDSNGTIEYLSPSVKRINGFDLEEAKDKTFFDLLQPEDRDLGKIFLREVIASPGRPLHSSFRIQHKKNLFIWVEGTMTNLLHDENVKALIFNYRDITERKAAERRIQKSEANLKTIFNNTNIAYVFADKDFRVISYNNQAIRKYQKELGVQIKEGDNLISYLPAERQSESKKRFDRVLEGHKVNYETSFIQEDGSTFWYFIEMFPVNDSFNNLLGFIISSEDITPRKIIELERITMISDIIQHNKDLQQFAYIISHNLRSPVANILGLSNILNDTNELTPENFKKCLDGLTLSAKKLDEIIIDLNYILQTRRGINEQKETVSFADLLEDIKSLLSGLIEKENISIAGDFTVKEMTCIKSYLHSIFFNLVSNSIKYRRTGIQTEILITSKIENNKLILSFKDNGLGIDTKMHEEKLFGLYKRFHTHVEGKGMGLYMVKTQVEILGGAIRIRSQVNKGTEFVLEFGI